MRSSCSRRAGSSSAEVLRSCCTERAASRRWQTPGIEADDRMPSPPKFSAERCLSCDASWVPKRMAFSFLHRVSLIRRRAPFFSAHPWRRLVHRSRQSCNASSSDRATKTTNRSPRGQPILANKPDLWIGLGDIVYGGGSGDKVGLATRYASQKAQPDYRSAARSLARLSGCGTTTTLGKKTAVGKARTRRGNQKLLSISSTSRLIARVESRLAFLPPPPSDRGETSESHLAGRALFSRKGGSRCRHSRS